MIRDHSTSMTSSVGSGDPVGNRGPAAASRPDRVHQGPPDGHADADGTTSHQTAARQREETCKWPLTLSAPTTSRRSRG